MLKNAIKVACFVFAVLFVFGIGSYFYLKDVWDFDFVNGTESGTVVLMGYYGDAKNVKIPDRLRGKKVVSIGESAFKESDIVSVELSKYITTVEKNAFRECKALQSVKLSDGIRSLGESAFLKCSSLESINIPSSLEKIGEAAFLETGIKTLDFSKNNNFVLDNGVIYDKDMTKIYQALSTADLSDYVCPPTVTVINSYAFNGHKELKAFTVNDGVKRLESATFLGCKGLTELVLPNSVVYVGPLAVSDSGIQKIYIPNNSVTIDKSAFLKLEDQITIVAPSNSAAERFAKNNNFKCEISK